MKMDSNDIGKLIRRTLLSGVMFAMVCFSAGFLLGAGDVSVRLFWAGTVALVLTPVLRVIMLVIGFFFSGEYWFSLSAFCVAALLAVSIFF